MISGRLDFRLLHANYMNGGICSSFEVGRMPYWRSLSGSWKPWWQPHSLLHYILQTHIYVNYIYTYAYANYMNSDNYSLFKVVELSYWRQQRFDDSLIFAKYIDNQHFLISILPFDLLLWLEGKMPTSQHFWSSF